MKWIINVAYENNDNKHYEMFKRRMLRSGIKGIKESDFDDKHFSFKHLCREPKDVFDYFYLLNPVNKMDDIYNDAAVSIVRGNAVRGRRPWGKDKDKDAVKKDIVK